MPKMKDLNLTALPANSYHREILISKLERGCGIDQCHELGNSFLPVPPSSLGD